MNVKPLSFTDIRLINKTNDFITTRTIPNKNVLKSNYFLYPWSLSLTRVILAVQYWKILASQLTTKVNYSKN